ncbi:MAG: tetratricopeptide repeat protein [Anaerolineae bacterium]|nr:tetratricopeptide repeat protein [Anaerolineae bacterium]
MRVEKTVFICYRRTNYYTALAVYNELKRHDYDVFLDYRSINVGDWRRVILAQISARAHFLIILTPEALERCLNPSDVMRMEIEHAIAERRNIIPLFFEGFEFNETIHNYLSPGMKNLPRYSGMSVPEGYFDEALERVRTRHLNVPLDMVLHPITPVPNNHRREAETWFEWGFTSYANGHFQSAVVKFTRAIELQSNYGHAYYRRGHAQRMLLNKDAAIDDFIEALRFTRSVAQAALIQSNLYRVRGNLKRALEEANIALSNLPSNAELHKNRGDILGDMGQHGDAIDSYQEALRLNPRYAFAHNNLGLARQNNGDFEGAIKDYDRAIRLNPKDANAFNNRGVARQHSGDLDGAIHDYNQAIRLNPQFTLAFNNRGWAQYSKGDANSAIADFEAALRIEPHHELARKNLDIAHRKKRDE